MYNFFIIGPDTQHGLHKYLLKEQMSIVHDPQIAKSNEHIFNFYLIVSLSVI
jgi:hypothetical protein